MESLSPNARFAIEGVALVSALVDLRARTLAGEDAATLEDERAAWQSRRAAWWADMEATVEDGGWVPLLSLSVRLGLGPREVDLLLAALGPFVDPEFLDRVGRSRPGFYFRGLDAELLVALVFHTPEERFAGRALLSASGALLRHGLLQLVPVGTDLSPHVVEVRASESLANFVLDRPLLTGTLGQYCEMTTPAHTWDHVILPERDKAWVWELVSGAPEVERRLDEWGFGAVLPRGRGLVLLFAGPPGTGKSMFAHAIASRMERPLLVVRTSRILATPEAVHPVLSEAFRVASLTQAVVVLDDCEGLLGERDARFLALLEALDRHEGLLVLTTNRAPSIDFAMERRIHHRLDFELPSPELRERIWETHLTADAPLSDDIDVATLASGYELSGARIRSVVLIALARMSAQGAPRLTMEGLREAADSVLGARLDDLAVRSRNELGIERLVLPPDPREQIRELLSACRHREFVLGRWGFGRSLTTGRGLCALFDGPPGTGKTFAAELLAAELRLPLYRVHIPNIVSKWVGETERNLVEIFARARASRAILLFDEADALFGRRIASVQTASDRYGNMEVNLLLQEIERYDGITFLTTNLFGNLDEALQRRIQFRVTFPFPEAAERARIWRVLTPPEAPLASDVDFEAVGKRFELAGGHIKNALLRAAYRARDDGELIRQQHLVDAALAECRAQGKLIRSLPTPPA